VKPDTGFGRTRETTTPGVYNVVFSYIEEEAGKYSAVSSVNIFKAIAEGKSQKELNELLNNDIQKLREIRGLVRVQGL